MRKKSLMSSFGGSHLSKRRASVDKDDPFEDPDSGVGLQRKSREEDISMSQYRKRNDSYMRDIDKTNDDPNSRIEVHTDQKDDDPTARHSKRKKTRAEATNDDEAGLGQFQRKKFRKQRSDIIPPAQAKFVGFKLNN